MKLGSVAHRIRGSVATHGLAHTLQDLSLRAANRLVLIKILKCMAIERINPGFTIESWKRLAVHKDPKDVEHRLDGLRKAGLPES